MALIKCPECGKEFSSFAKCCPNCACPTELILRMTGGSAGSSGSAPEAVDPRLEFTLSKDKKSYSVKKYRGNSQAVVIPSVYDGKPVTKIGGRAFSYTGLTSITIPNSVTSIGYAAFACSSLTSVTIPDSVTNIGNAAFANCYGLTSIKIPDSVKTIRDYAFRICKHLTSVTIGVGVTSIGDQAFYDCDLTSITIPDSVTSIGFNAFSGCGRLTSITVEEGNPIYHSEGNCLITTKYKTLTAGCNNSIIPSDGSVKAILGEAFRGCIGLVSVTIPDSVVKIGTLAFSGCSCLTSITIPDSVTSIDERAFLNCSSLTEISFLGTEEEWNAIKKGEGWDENLGNGSYRVNFVG